MEKNKAILITTFLGMLLLGAAACANNDNAVKSGDEYLAQEVMVGDTLRYRNVPGLILKRPVEYDPGPDDYYYLIDITEYLVDRGGYIRGYGGGVAYWPDSLPEKFKEDSLRVVFSGFVPPIPPGYRLIAALLVLLDIRRENGE